MCFGWVVFSDVVWVGAYFTTVGHITSDGTNSNRAAIRMMTSELQKWPKLLVFTSICSARGVNNASRWGLGDYPYGSMLRAADVFDAVRGRKVSHLVSKCMINNPLRSLSDKMPPQLQLLPRGNVVTIAIEEEDSARAKLPLLPSTPPDAVEVGEGPSGAEFRLDTSRMPCRAPNIHNLTIFKVSYNASRNAHSPISLR